MKTRKRFLYSLPFAIMIVCGLIFIISCEPKPTAPLEQPEIEPGTLPQFEGKVIDGRTGSSIADATVNVGGVSIKTDASGKFIFTTLLPLGKQLVTIQKSGYLTVKKTIDMGTTISIVYYEFRLIQSSTPKLINAATGGFVSQSSDEGEIIITIPPGALKENFNISFTPVLGFSSPVEAGVVGQLPGLPAQTALLEPTDLQFLLPVEMKLPLTIPQQYLTGTVKVYRINPQTSTPEDAGTATIVNGAFVFNVTKGGQYIVKANATITHEVETINQGYKVGGLDFNELPGTSKTFTYNIESKINPDPGFSKNFLEYEFGFSSSSKSVDLAISKPTGVNTAVFDYILLTSQSHYFKTSLGKSLKPFDLRSFFTNPLVIAGLVATAIAVPIALAQHRTQFEDTTHHTYKNGTWYWKTLYGGRALTAAEILLYGLPSTP